MPRLVMMSGLPGSGKSTLSRMLAEQSGATLLRIDVFEQDLRNLHGPDFDVGTLGYQEGYERAARHLAAGHHVIADAVNAVEAARQGWRDVVGKSGADIVEIEILCSDVEENRIRLQTRDTGIAGLPPVDPEAAAARRWEPSSANPQRIDTAGRTAEACLRDLLERTALT
ncbi:ATP-binding protein [uncultured Hyphomonas sp.]|uniref:AAA family ATPase n=1 Tax=uncultured Hyphomonas sp. TaxID=225298 RepID=UPI002AAAEE01|nr:ATP-binding protein [uncultured Hyphomonas sp.]